MDTPGCGGLMDLSAVLRRGNSGGSTGAYWNFHNNNNNNIATGDEYNDSSSRSSEIEMVFSDTVDGDDVSLGESPRSSGVEDYSPDNRGALEEGRRSSRRVAYPDKDDYSNSCVLSVTGEDNGDRKSQRNINDNTSMNNIIEAEENHDVKDDHKDDDSNGKANEETWKVKEALAKVLCFFCCCGRCLTKFRETFPRCYAVIVRVFFPLWILILCSALGGYLLARLEAPAEFDANDFILTRRIIQTGRLAEGLENSFDLPLRCYNNYLEFRLGKPTPTQEFFWDFFDLDSILYNETAVSIYLNNTSNSSIEENPQLLLESGNQTYEVDGSVIEEKVEKYINETREYMEACGKEAGKVFSRVADIAISVREYLAANQLSFTWIRCWDESEYGPMLRVITPSEEQLEATWNQSQYYEKLWLERQDELFRGYLQFYPDTPVGRALAYNRSIDEATGRHGCEKNVGGTTWFWFTIMSTVGYGNQSPNTEEGRKLVVIFGIFSILLFGAILAVASQVVNALFEDLLHFCGLRILNRPIILSVAWCSLTVGYIFLLGILARQWWHARLPPDENELVTVQEAWWFAFISSTTIGLGDLFLQPEYLFIGDVLAFSGYFLIGFVCITTFLSNVGQCLTSVIRIDTFGEELRRAKSKHNLFNVDGDTDKDEDGPEISNDVITTLQELLEKSEDNDKSFDDSREKRLRELMKEEELTRQLLRKKREAALKLFNNEDSDEDRIFQQHDLSQIRNEENLFKEMYDRITSERIELENDTQNIYTTCSQTTVHA